MNKADDVGVATLRGYPVTIRRFEFAGRSIELLGPANYESLIDDERVVARFEKDEFMPYWAEFWPACLLLADLVAAWPAANDLSGGPTPCVLELGAGLGLVSLIAAARGYRVVCSDYEEDALAFVRESAKRNGLVPPDTRYIDWRERYDDQRFDRIVAAEVLYETRNLAPIATFVAAHLAPGGEAILVDRNRPTADAFASVARAAGLSVEITSLRRAEGCDSKLLEGRAFFLRRPEDAE